MNIIKDIDWQMICFVGLSLANEYLTNIHYPRIYYWNGRRDFLKKLGQNNDDHNNNKAA